MDTLFVKLSTIVIAIITSVLYIWLILRKKDSLKKILSVKGKETLIPVLIAAMASIIGIFAGIVGSFDKLNLGAENKFLAKDMMVLTEKISEMENRLSKIESIPINDLTNDSLGQPLDTNIEIEKIKNDLNKTKSSITKFEELLISDAEKLITLPLMKKELESIKIEIKTLRDNTNSQNHLIQEMQNQNRWIIGTLGLGILALIIPIVKATVGSSRKENDF